MLSVDDDYRVHAINLYPLATKVQILVFRGSFLAFKVQILVIRSQIHCLIGILKVLRACRYHDGCDVDVLVVFLIMDAIASVLNHGAFRFADPRAERLDEIERSEHLTDRGVLIHPVWEGIFRV